MSPKTSFPTRLSASSYNSPTSHDPSNPYTPLRAAVIATATAMGYDPTTMTERGLVWAEDQDPFGHVMNPAFTHFLSMGNFRVVESFEQWLGPAEYDNMITARSIGPVVQKYETHLKRQASYPDALLIAHRLTEVKPHGYLGVTSIWSLRLQTIVAESTGWVFFYDFGTGRRGDLVKKGGVYKDLYEGLKAKAEEANRKVEEWEKAEKGKGKGKAKAKL